MAIDRGTFENLNPLQFISLTYPNHFINPYGDFLRIAILDAPIQTTDPQQIAAMLVPKDRENDWIFNTETGHLQLLYNSPGISRLIIIGNPPQDADNFPTIYTRPICNDTTYRKEFEDNITPLLFALSPKASFVNGVPEIQFVTYEDNVVRSVPVEIFVGSPVGEMLVEDVELELERDDKFEKSPVREFRRRLRFKRMPNLVQTEIRIVPDTLHSESEVKFRPDMSCLVHPYLPPMVASLSLIAPYLEEQFNSSSRPRVLCVGVGGGALLTFLQTQFGFKVFGVECDETVLKVAKQYFGLVEGELLRVYVEDGIRVLEKFARKGIRGNVGTEDVEVDQNLDIVDECNSSVDVIMVDLDSSDARNGLGAPPLEFIRKPVLLTVKLALSESGILVVNVIPLDKSFYNCLIHEFQEVFVELYEIDVGNGENYVLIATVSPIRVGLDGNRNSILEKLKLIISGEYIDLIRKI